MDAAAGWRTCFAQWPDELPRRGLVVTNFNEQIPFQGFMTAEAVVLLERSAPDAVGGRFVIVPYAGILAVKLVDVAKPKALNEMGFAGALLKK